MEKNITKVLPQKVASESENTIGGDGLHVEESSSVSVGKNLENCGKKVLVDLNTKLQGEHGKPNVKEPDEADIDDREDEEEEIVLRLQSSDEDIFEDAVGEVAEVRKATIEKYFSDIESSDDSQVYEPKSKVLKEVAEGTSEGDPDLDEQPAKVSSPKEVKPPDEGGRSIELEFEPVESDEEDFEESPPLEEKPPEALSRVELFEVGPPSEVEDFTSDAECPSVPVCTTPLIDEEEESTPGEVPPGVLESDKNADEGLVGDEAIAASALLEEDECATKETGKQEPLVQGDVSVVDSMSDSVVEEDARESLATTIEKVVIDTQDAVTNTPEGPTKITEKVGDAADDHGASGRLSLSTDASKVEETVPEEEESNEVSKKQTDVQKGTEVDSELETCFKNKESTAEIVEIDPKSVHSKEHFHNVEEEIIEGAASPEKAEKSPINIEKTDDSENAIEKEGSTEKVDISAEKVPEEVSSSKAAAISEESELVLPEPQETLETLLGDKRSEKLHKITEMSDEKPIQHLESLEEADASPKPAIKPIKTTEEPLQNPENSTNGKDCSKISDESKKHSMDSSVALKSLETSEKDSVENAIEAETSEKTTSEEKVSTEKPDESQKSDKSTEDVTEKRVSLETADKSNEKPENPIGIETTNEKISAGAEKCEKATKELDKSQQTAEKLPDICSESTDNEPIPTIEYVEKNSSEKEGTKEADESVELKTDEVMKNIMDKSKPIGAGDTSAKAETEEAVKKIVESKLPEDDTSEGTKTDESVKKILEVETKTEETLKKIVEESKPIETKDDTSVGDDSVDVVKKIVDSTKTKDGTSVGDGPDDAVKKIVEESTPIETKDGTSAGDGSDDAVKKIVGEPKPTETKDSTSVGDGPDDAVKKIAEESKLTDTKDDTTAIKAKNDSGEIDDAVESLKRKSSEIGTIEVDDNQVDDRDNKKKKVEATSKADGEENDEKEADAAINTQKAMSTEESAKKEAKKDDPPAKVIEVVAEPSKNANQSEENNQASDKEKEEDKAVSVTGPEAKLPQKPESVTEAEKVDEDKINNSEELEDKDEVEMLEIIDTSDNEDTPATDSQPKEEQSIKDDTMMKSSENSVQARPDDDDEPLLMIDTAHKEDNDNEYNDMDTETEQTATSAPTTDSSSDGSLEIFYDKECVNYECKRGSKNFYRATLFSLNYYKISKKRNKVQFACEECYDRALDSYEEMCRTLKQKQPLLHGATFKGQEYVEIIDSSDEEESDSTGEKFKDENVLPKESIQLLEAELAGAIRKVMHNVEIQNQLSWTKQILQQRLNNLEEDTEFVSEQLRLLQKKTDNMHNSLYQCPKIKIRQLTPLDLNSGRSYNPETESTIPPMGEVLRSAIHVNETYYAVKNKAIASWVPCKVTESMDSYLPHTKNLKHYKIKFLKSKYPMLKTVSAKHMAFFNPPKVRLPIGTRVIAYFDASSLSRGKEKMQIPSAFYPGIIAEPLKQSNKFRYLVFYDDGYFQYVYHKDVRLVCQASEQVWEDVHHQSREFIHNYLTQYAVNRPMVQTQKGQSMLVDYNGKWIYARVIDVDCSLVQMLYEGQSRSEWIYRGSTRLGPVYKESNNLVQKNQWGTSRRRTEPFIRYFNGDDTSSTSQQPQENQQPAKPGEVRSVAKKSVSRTDTSQSSQPVPAVRHLNNSTIFVDDDNKPKGKVVYYTARKNLPPRDYVSHICNSSCPFTITHNLMYYSPLAKPLLSGWERQVFRQKSKKFIVYRGPCGKRMRCMEELHRYLRVTENDLNVDNFDFSPETNCLAEYVIESCIVQKKDISNGKEKMPIPCVNYYDNTMPPDCIYSSRRIPTEGVPLNLDREFLVGCDCEDDCSDKTKCSCWELTYAGAKYGMPNVPNEMVGYQYKRLYEHVPTGIYECNSRCKCKANCVNRVVQQPLQSKLQVFKTSNRGWGLRCINDVPRGSFICVYAGHLLTEQKANEGGLDAGDEYFAELDYIEVAEQIKEGYESDVGEPDEDEELYNPEKEDEDDDEFVAPSESHRNKAFNTRLRARRSTKGSTDAEHDSQERQVISFEPNKTMGQPDTSTSEKPTIRKLFGKDEACYIMDAKVTGNLGRYFNHSCSPNLFVQNVFVDTHDLRFPWVAFFAFTHIRAGTELTWNYNYEVGVVPGKVLYCQCGAPNCRQRLL